MREVERILKFMNIAERLKLELRHSWLSNGRQESVAEHCWQMAIMALLIHRHLAVPVNLEKLLKIILVHDLVEAEAGDVPFFETGDRKRSKAVRERAAIQSIRDAAGGATGEEIFQLWCEFEDKSSGEARIASALDHLEGQIQHNLADLKTWESVEYDLVYTKMDAPCRADPLLIELCSAIKVQAETKMREAGVDPSAIRDRTIGTAEISEL